MTMKPGKGKKSGDNHKASSGNDKKTSSSKKKQEEIEDDENDDMEDDDETPTPAKKGAKAVASKKSSEDDDDDEGGEDELDDWEKPEEEENWDPDFDEFDIPASKNKKGGGGGGKKGKDDDDDFKKQSSSKGRRFAIDGDPVENSENHSGAAEPRERQENADRHFALVRAAYESATGNRWSESDSEAYNENGIAKLPAETLISAMQAVARRTSAKICSFNYFVKAIVTLRDPRNRAWQKKQIEKIVRRIRDSTVGRSGYSGVDFVEDVKCACAREAVPFDNDIFNELVS